MKLEPQRRAFRLPRFDASLGTPTGCITCLVFLLSSTFLAFHAQFVVHGATPGIDLVVTNVAQVLNLVSTFVLCFGRGAGRFLGFTGALLILLSFTCYGAPYGGWPSFDGPAFVRLAVQSDGRWSRLAVYNLDGSSSRNRGNPGIEVRREIRALGVFDVGTLEHSRKGWATSATIREIDAERWGVWVDDRLPIIVGR